MMPPSWQAVRFTSMLLPMVTLMLPQSHRFLRLDRQTMGSPVRLAPNHAWSCFTSEPIYYCRSQNRQPIQALEEARDSVQALYVGTSRIMTGSVDGHVRTYDLRKGELRADYIGRTCATPHVLIHTCRNRAFFSSRSRHFRRPYTRRIDVYRDDARRAHSPHGRYHRKVA
jgi:hypothetical protein